MATQGFSNLTTVFSECYDAIWQLRDKRVDGWPLMSSPLPTMMICATYVFIVKILGPKLMQNRPPFQLKTFLIVYNAFQVVLSAYIFIQLLRGGWWRDYSYFCQPVDYSDSPKAMLMLHAGYVYYLSKFTEFVDTFCFVARKKFGHVSLLHVVHHGIMPLSVWPGIRFLPGGHSSFFALANSFVHIVMYVYYLLAALGPKYQKYIFWKQHLTTFQMIQFIAIMAHGFQLMFYDDCGFPHQFAYYIAAHAVMFFFLFAQFYVKSYLSPRKPKGPDGSKGATSKLESENEKSDDTTDVIRKGTYVVRNRHIVNADQLLKVNDDVDNKEANNNGGSRKSLASVGSQSELEMTLKPERPETDLETSQILGSLLSELKLIRQDQKIQGEIVAELKQMRQDQDIKKEILAELKAISGRMDGVILAETRAISAELKSLSDTFKNMRSASSFKTSHTAPKPERAVSKIDEGIILDASDLEVFERNTVMTAITSTPDRGSTGAETPFPGMKVSKDKLPIFDVNRKKYFFGDNSTKAVTPPASTTSAFVADTKYPMPQRSSSVGCLQADKASQNAASVFENRTNTNLIERFTQLVATCPGNNTFSCCHPDFKSEEPGRPIQMNDLAGNDTEEIFNRWAKGYRYDPESKEWKEIGTGNVTIVTHKSLAQLRLLVWSDQVKKVVFNHFIDERIELKPMPVKSATSNLAVSYFAFNFVSNTSKLEYLAIEFNREEALRKFETVVRLCQEKVKNHK